MYFTNSETGYITEVDFNNNKKTALKHKAIKVCEGDYREDTYFISNDRELYVIYNLKNKNRVISGVEDCETIKKIKLPTKVSDIVRSRKIILVLDDNLEVWLGFRGLFRKISTITARSIAATNKFVYILSNKDILHSINSYERKKMMEGPKMVDGIENIINIFSGQDRLFVTTKDNSYYIKDNHCILPSKDKDDRILPEYDAKHFQYITSVGELFDRGGFVKPTRYVKFWITDRIFSNGKILQLDADIHSVNIKGDTILIHLENSKTIALGNLKNLRLEHDFNHEKVIYVPELEGYC